MKEKEENKEEKLKKDNKTKKENEGTSDKNIVEKKDNKKESKEKKETKKEETEKSEEIKETKKVEPKNEEKKKEKKSKKKAIIITIIAVVLLVAIGVGGFFGWQYLELKKPIEQAWGQTYYLYIKDALEIANADNVNDTGISKDMENAKIEFSEIENIEDPVMILSYEKDNNEYTNIYYINDDKVNRIVTSDNQPSNVKVLYNIENKAYNWYTHISTENEDIYTPISEQIAYTISYLNRLATLVEKSETEENIIDGNKIDAANINSEVFKKGDTTTVETVDGDILSMPKFDEKFIETDLADQNKTDFNTDVTEKELKEEITKTVNDYKTKEEIVTEETKSKVESKETEITNKKQEMQSAEEERKRQEEAMKITGENMISKVGEHLKYFSAAYLGRDYGLYKLYTIKDRTGEIKIPGQNEYMMTEEVVGLSSIQTLKDALNKYLSSDVISKTGRYDSITNLKEYNGKVYIVRGGIGDGPDIDYKKAKLISSEGETSKIQLSERNVLVDEIVSYITVTVTYDKQTKEYKITDYSVRNLY